MDDGAEVGPEPVRSLLREHVFEAAGQDGDAGVVARDVLHLEAVGGQSGDFVAGFPEKGQHSAHAGARVKDGLAGAVDPAPAAISA